VIAIEGDLLRFNNKIVARISPLLGIADVRDFEDFLLKRVIMQRENLVQQLREGLTDEAKCSAGLLTIEEVEKALDRALK
jgi:hypothetical protein